MIAEPQNLPKMTVEEYLEWEAKQELRYEYIDGIESLGRSERRELKNRLMVLFAHFLKRMYVNSPENFNG